MEIPDNISTAIKSKDVFVPHYWGLSTPEIVTENGYTKASYSNFLPHSFSFDNAPGIEKNLQDLMKNTITYEIVSDENGNLEYVITTASGPSNKFIPLVDLTHDGKPTLNPVEDLYNPGDPSDRMAGWLANKGMIEYYERPARSGILIEGPEERTSYSEFSAMPDVERYVKQITAVGPININDVGSKFSENANEEEKIKNFLFINYLKERPHYDPELGDYTYIKESTLDWTKSLFSKHIDEIGEVKGIGSGNLSDENALAVTINKSFLVLASDLYEIAWQEAEALGLKGREAQEYVTARINSVLEHEEYHFLEPDKLPERASETRAGELQSEFYDEQAELKEGTVEGRIYAILARYYAEYAENASNGELSKLERLAKEYKEEALASGMDEAEAENYVENKLEEYAEKDTENNEEYSKKEMCSEDVQETEAEPAETAAEPE